MNNSFHVTNNDGSVNYLQVSHIYDIPAGNFSPDKVFVVNNITDDNITIQIRPAGQNEFISTVLYTGWNPILIKEIQGVEANTLQYGY